MSTEELLKEFAAKVGLLLREYQDKHEIQPAILAKKLLEIAKALPDNRQPSKYVFKQVPGV
jgi:hypothetical protein